MNDGHGYALLIGVNDYTTYSSNGAFNLQGSLNDVALWWKMCQDLGYAPQNIRVLTSPALTGVDLKGAYTGAATHDEILKGLKWLADAVGGDKTSVGLLTFSGHGDEANLGLVICPSDTSTTTGTGEDLGGVVHLLEMQTLLAGAAHRLTVVLDCCHSRTNGVGYRVPLALRYNPGSGGLPIPSIGDRMFYAAKGGTSAYQSEFAGGDWHGALTWAFMTTRAQWILGYQDDHTMLTISNADMQSRAQCLLDALTFNQTTMLGTPKGTDQSTWPVFGTGPGETSSDPNGGRVSTQLNPSEYTLTLWYTDATGTTYSPQLAQIIVTGVPTPPNQLPTIVQQTGGTITTSINTEYWYVDPTVVAIMTNPANTLLRIEIAFDDTYRTTYYVFTGGTVNLTPRAENPGWLQVPDPDPSNACLFKLTNAAGYCTQALRLDTSTGVITPIVWYQYYAARSGAQNIKPSGKFNYATTVLPTTYLQGSGTVYLFSVSQT